MVKVRVAALDSTLSPSNSGIWGSESRLASENSEVDFPPVKLESDKHRFCLAEEASSLWQEQVRSQGPQLCKLEAGHIAAEAARAVAESYFESLTAS